MDSPWLVAVAILAGRFAIRSAELGMWMLWRGDGDGRSALNWRERETAGYPDRCGT